MNDAMNGPGPGHRGKIKTLAFPWGKAKVKI